MLCPGYTKTLDLVHNEVLALDDARGATLRVTRGTLWITQAGDSRDIVLTVGDVWTIERNGRTVIESQGPSILCLLGEGVEPTRARERSAGLVNRVFARLARFAATRLQRRPVPYF